MSYRKHLFFCLNQKASGKKCCHEAGADELFSYAKKRIKRLGLSGKGGIRVNKAGCLGRCQEGPCLVIYPEGVWYTYTDEADIDEIIETDVIKNKRVERLLIETGAEQ